MTQPLPLPIRRVGCGLQPGWSVYALLPVAILLAPGALATDRLAIRAGKVITMAGEPIENGIVLIQDGKIEAVGKDIAIPIEAHVIEAKDQVVMPGFVEAHSSEGMGQANERNEIVPFLSVVDSIDPSLDYFEESRRNGVTTAAIVPGNNTLIGGQAVIMKTAGQFVNDMIVKRDAGMKISLRPTSGGRMGQLARLRRELDKAKAALEKRKAGQEVKAEPEPKEEPKAEEAEGESGENRPQENAGGGQTSAANEAANAAKGLDAMIAVIEGKLPVFFYCDSAMDVATAKQLTADYQLRATYVLGRDTYKAAKLLSGSQQPVILDRNLIFWETDPRTQEDKKIVLPEVFQNAGVPFVFQTGDGSLRTTNSSAFLWYQAAVAVRSGMSPADALHSLTLAPAKLLGIADTVGSIEPGKDADLVLWTGDPLKLSTWVDKTIVNGEIVYDRAQDTKLERLLSPKAE